MSLPDQKKALFGKGSTTPASVSSNGGKPPSVSVKSSVPVVKKVSPQIKIAKIKEAKELSAKATEQTKTSLFRWSPDYLAAAPIYEQAAEAYKVAEEYDMARLMLVSASEAHEGYGSLSSAALALSKASKIASQFQSDKRSASRYLEMAAAHWATNGDVDRYADYLSKAAIEVENDDLEEAVRLYGRAAEVVCPPDTPKDLLHKCPVIIMDIYKSYFRCLLQLKGPHESLLPIANRLVDIFESFDIENGMCKMMLTVTFLELSSGDVVRADHTFLNIHLNNKTYANCKECEVADMYVTAFKRQDITLLDDAKSHNQINYLDKEIQSIARNLSLFTAKNNYVMTDVISTHTMPRPQHNSGSINDVLMHEPSKDNPSDDMNGINIHENDNTDVKIKETDIVATMVPYDEDEINLA